MRVICWNVRGNGGRDYDLPGLLDSWGADLVIFLEPPQWMRNRETGETQLLHKPVPRQGPVPSAWRLVGCKEGHTQGHAFVAYREGSAVAMRSAQVPGTAQDNRLMLVRATVRGETRNIAACHAPFAQNSGEAAQYIVNAMAAIRQGGDGIAANWPDLWLGDFNTYGVTAPQGAAPNYELVLARCTSGFGQVGAAHFPLDKILKRAMVPVQGCGRILPQSQLASPGEIVTHWRTDDTVPSDHLPVFVDTGAGAAPVWPGLNPPPAPDEDDENPRRFRFEDPPKVKRRHNPKDEV